MDRLLLVFGIVVVALVFFVAAAAPLYLAYLKAKDQEALPAEAKTRSPRRH